jgi:hypothetical protein
MFTHFICAKCGVTFPDSAASETRLPFSGHWQCRRCAGDESIAGHELAVAIISDGTAYRRWAVPVIRRARRIHAKGELTEDMLASMFLDMAMVGAQIYNGQFGTPMPQWYTIFSPEDIAATARELAEHYKEEVEGSHGREQ